MRSHDTHMISHITWHSHDTHMTLTWHSHDLHSTFSTFCADSSSWPALEVLFLWRIIIKRRSWKRTYQYTHILKKAIAITRSLWAPWSVAAHKFVITLKYFVVHTHNTFNYIITYFIVPQRKFPDIWYMRIPVYTTNTIPLQSILQYTIVYYCTLHS